MLPQQPQRSFLRFGRAATIGDAFPGERGTSLVQVPKGLPQAIRAHYDQKCQSRGSRYGAPMLTTNDPATCS